jgi:beta-glucosidase
VLINPWLVILGPNFGWGVTGTSADIFDGHLVSGGGSGQISLPYVITPLHSLMVRAVEDESMIFWILNNSKWIKHSCYATNIN